MHCACCSGPPPPAAGAYEEGALDAAFARLTSIHTLALDRSAILAVPQGLSCLTNLRVLSMHQVGGAAPRPPWIAAEAPSQAAMHRSEHL